MDQYVLHQYNFKKFKARLKDVEFCLFLKVVDMLLKAQLKRSATFRSKASFPKARKRLPWHKTLLQGKKAFRPKILQVMSQYSCVVNSCKTKNASTAACQPVNLSISKQKVEN